MSTDAPRSARAASFGRGVAAYRRARPSYPDAAVRWLLPAPGRRVLDLAAGTGKLTERLHALGYDVTAVEPSDGMRAELHDAVPDVGALPGTAESIPVPDASMDAVVVAQAWHWFDEAGAATEISRVLRPGGRLGVLWNVRDHTVEWVDRLTDILHRGDSLEPQHGPPALGHRFGEVEHATFAWSHRLATGDLRTLAASRSHTLTLPDAEREELLDAVDELARTHPALAGTDTVDLPYRTECWRAALR